MSYPYRTREDLFGYEPNWAEPPVISYGFVTVTALSRVLNEQRKSLSIRPVRTQSFSLLVESDRLAIVLNWLRLYNSKEEDVVNIPIYTEPIRPSFTGGFAGFSKIDVHDISNYYNVQNYAKEVVLIDKREPPVCPLVKMTLEDVGDDYLDWVAQPSWPFVGEYTIIYPIMPVIITSHQVEHITNRISTIRFEAQEILDEDPIVGIGAS